MCTNVDEENKGGDEAHLQNSQNAHRQRMKPWLIERLDLNKIEGFSWVNEDEKTFRIAWRHGSRHGWNIHRDAGLFEQWARHTGKFKDGQEPNPKKWKANFRCALNSLQNVEEQKHQENKHGSNAFKIYKFIDKKRQRYRSSGKRKAKSEDLQLHDDEDRLSKSEKKHKSICSHDRNSADLSHENNASREGCFTKPTTSNQIPTSKSDSLKDLGIEAETLQQHQSGYVVVIGDTDYTTLQSQLAEDRTAVEQEQSDNDVINTILDFEHQYSNHGISKVKVESEWKIKLSSDDIKNICSGITETKDIFEDNTRMMGDFYYHKVTLS